MLIRFARLKDKINETPDSSPINYVFIDYYLDVLHKPEFPLNVIFMEPEDKENFLGYMLVHYPTEYAQIIDEEDAYLRSTFVLHAEILGD